MAQELSDEQRQLAVTFMTTEQFTLQTARSIATAEANGRATLYLSTLSSALVALGFVAQSSEFGRPFGIFALLVLPPICFLGFVTFQRAIQTGIEDVFSLQSLARVRSFYVELLPEMRPWFMEPTDETRQSPVQRAAQMGRWQLALTVATSIGVTNSVVVGATSAIVLNLIFAPALPVTVLIGLGTGILAALGHFRYQNVAWTRIDPYLRSAHPVRARDGGS